MTLIPVPLWLGRMTIRTNAFWDRNKRLFDDLEIFTSRTCFCWYLFGKAVLELGIAPVFRLLIATRLSFEWWLWNLWLRTAAPCQVWMHVAVSACCCSPMLLRGDKGCQNVNWRTDFVSVRADVLPMKILIDILALNLVREQLIILDGWNKSWSSKRY